MEKNKIMEDKEKKTPETLPADFDFKNAPETLPADFSFDDSPKSKAPSNTGGKSGAVTTPSTSTLPSAGLKSASSTQTTKPVVNQGVAAKPTAKPVDAVSQTKIVQPKIKESYAPTTQQNISKIEGMTMQTKFPEYLNLQKESNTQKEAFDFKKASAEAVSQEQKAEKEQTLKRREERRVQNLPTEIEKLREERADLLLDKSTEAKKKVLANEFVTKKLQKELDNLNKSKYENLQNLNQNAIKGIDLEINEYLQEDPKLKDKIKAVGLTDNELWDLSQRAIAKKTAPLLQDLQIFKDEGTIENATSMIKLSDDLRGKQEKMNKISDEMRSYETEYLNKTGFSGLNKEISASKQKLDYYEPYLKKAKAEANIHKKELDELKKRADSFSTLIKDNTWLGTPAQLEELKAIEKEYDNTVQDFNNAYKSESLLGYDEALTNYNNLINTKNNLVSGLKSPEYQKMADNLNGLKLEYDFVYKDYEKFQDPKIKGRINEYFSTVQKVNEYDEKIKTTKGNLTSIEELEKAQEKFNKSGLGGDLLDVGGRAINSIFDASKKFIASPFSIASSFSDLAGTGRGTYHYSDWIADLILGTGSNELFLTKETNNLYDAKTDSFNWGFFPTLGALADQAGIILTLGLTGKFALPVLEQRMVTAGMDLTAVAEASKAAEFATTVVPAFMISYGDNYKQALSKGFSVEGAIAYSSGLSLLEGLTERLLPDQDLIFGKAAKDQLLSGFIKDFSKGKRFAIANLTKKFVYNAGGEAVEENIAILGEVAATVAGHLTNENIEIEIPKINQTISTNITSAISGGGMGLIGSVSEQSQMYKMGVISLANDFETGKSLLDVYKEKGKIDEKRYNKLISDAQNFQSVRGQIPQGLSGFKTMAIFEKMMAIKGLSAQMDKDETNPFNKINAKKISVIQGEIEQIVDDKNFDARAEYELTLESEELNRQLEQKPQEEKPQEEKPVELKKNTSPTPANYGTINRNDGKGVVNLTQEEFEAEQANMQPKADGTAPVAEMTLDEKKTDLEKRRQDELDNEISYIAYSRKLETEGKYDWQKDSAKKFNADIRKGLEEQIETDKYFIEKAKQDGDTKYQKIKEDDLERSTERLKKYDEINTKYDTELAELNKATPEAIAGETIKTTTNEKANEDGEQKRGKDGEEDVTKSLQSEGEDGGQQVDLKENKVLGTEGAVTAAPNVELPVTENTNSNRKDWNDKDYEQKIDSLQSDKEKDAEKIKGNKTALSVREQKELDESNKFYDDAIAEYKKERAERRQAKNKADSTVEAGSLVGREVVTPEGFTNRVFESNMQLGQAPSDAHISEEGYNYRVLSQNEIDAIRESGGVFSREGKQKGGNKNTKYWTKGNNKNWYGDKNNLETIRVNQSNFSENEVVRAENVEVYNKETGKFEPLIQEAPKTEQQSIQETPITEEKVVAVEGSTVKLPPLFQGGMERTMVFKDGNWQQEVGGSLNRVGDKVQAQADEAFKASQKAGSNVEGDVKEPTSVTAEDGWTFVRMPDGSYTDGDQIYSSWNELKKANDSEGLGLKQSTKEREQQQRNEDSVKEIENEILNKEFKTKLDVWNYINDEVLKRMGYESPMDMSDEDLAIHTYLVKKGVEEFESGQLATFAEANKIIEQSLPTQEEVIQEEEEQYEPITVSDTSHDTFTKDNAVDYEEDEKEGDNGRTYTYLSSVTVELTDDNSGDTIGTISKLKSEDGEVTYSAEDADGNLVAEEVSSKAEAQQAVVDKWNKQKLKEFNKEKAAEKKAKAKEAEKAKKKAEKEAAKKKPAPKKTKSEQIAEGLLNVLGIENIGKVKNAAQKVQEALEATGISVEVLDNKQDFQDKLDSEGVNRESSAGATGVFISKSGKIFIDASKVNAEWGNVDVWHEGTHPIINIIRNTNPKLYNSIVDGLNKLVSSNPDIAAVVEWAKSNYEGENTLEDETIVETIARIANGNIDLSKIPTSLRDKIIDFINEIAKSLGLNPILKNSSIATFKKMAGDISTALKEGKDISSIVGKENVKSFENLKNEDGSNFNQFTISNNFKNLVNGIKFEYISNSEEFKDLVKNKKITNDKTLSYFEDMYVMLHIPDNAFTGLMFKDGELLVEGKGGVYFPIRFNKEGYFWASTEAGVDKLVDVLNKTRKANKDGKIRLALISSRPEKIMSSSNASNSMIDVLFSKAFDKRAKINDTQVRRAIFNASNEIQKIFENDYNKKINKLKNKILTAEKNIKNNVEVSENEKAKRSAEKSLKNAILNGAVKAPVFKINESADTYKATLANFYSVDNSSFDERKLFNELTLKNIADLINKEDDRLNGKDKKKERQIAQEVLTFLGKGDESIKFKTSRGGALSTANLMAGFSDLLGEPTLKGEDSNNIYAILEIDSDVEKVEIDDAHGSYPFAVKGKKGSNVVLHMLQDRRNWKQNILDPETNKPIGKKKILDKETGKPKTYEKRVTEILPTTAGITFTPVKISTKSQPQLSKGNRGDVAANENLINGFYSPLEKTINETKFDKLPAKQWIDKFAKGEEAKWTGLNEWLNQQQGSVSKADIQQFLKENRIEIKEIVKGSKAQELTKKEWINNRIKELIEEEIAEGTAKEDIDKSFLRDIANEQYIEESETYGTAPKSDTKFSKYQLEGEKSNYKEVLVTLPSKKIVTPLTQIEFYQKELGLTEAEIDKLDDNDERLNDVFKKWGTYQNSYLAKDVERQSKQFKSTHFDEPNILVHLRMNTRTDADGNKVLFLEEIQSDWGQEGKKEGFALTQKDKAKGWKIEESTDENGYYIVNPRGEKVSFEFDKEDANETLLELANTSNTTGELSRFIPAAPFVMDTNAWTKLGLKVALKEAVKQGATKIAWTTGEQQNERYDLSKQVDEIFYQKLSNGKYQIDANKNGDIVFTREFTEQELPNFVGKEVADKIVKNEGKFISKSPTYAKESVDKYSLKGEDLVIGGKGMKGFYGSPTEGSLGIVGNVAKSLFKQEPKTVEIEGEKQSDPNNVGIERVNGTDTWQLMDGNKNPIFDTYEDANNARKELKTNTSTQPSIDITPELKAEVEQGLPQFSKGREQNSQIKDYIESQRAAGESDADIRAGIESVADRIGLTEQDINDLMSTTAKAEDATATQPTEEKPIKKKKRRKSLLNRAFRGNNEQKVKDAIKNLGLFYETENQAQAKADAKEFIREVGDEAALDAVRKNLVEGGRAAFIYAEVIDNVMIDMANAKNIQESETLLAIQTELLDEFDRRARAGGQFNAALANVYATSDFNYKLTKQIEKYKAINNGIISPEVKAKFEELEAQLNEVNEQLKEAEARAKEAEEKAAIDNIKEDVNRNKEKETYTQKAKKVADKFRARFKTKPKFYDENGNEIEVFTAGFTWNDLVELAAKSIEKTGNVADGLKAVSEFVKDSDVYKKLTKKGQEALDGQINNYFGEEKISGRVKVPHSLIRRLVEEGNTDMDSLVAAVKQEMAEEYPDATDREIRDGITGYGKTVNQNQEEIEKQIRKLKFLGRAQSALEDIANKKRPLKSGAQRDKLDADERKLLKEIKEAMKDLPVDLETQDAQLKTALDAAKTRLRNKIEDLNKEIESGETAKKNNKPTITDQEYKDLVEQRDELQYQHDLIFKGKPQTVGEKKIKALEKQLDDLLTKEIKGQEASATFSEAEQKQIDALKEKINAAKEEMGLIASKPLPKTEMEKAEAREKAKIEALEKQLEDLRQGIIENKKDKAKTQESQEVKDLKAQIQKEKEFLGLIPANPTEIQLMEMVYDKAISDINDKIKNNDLAFKKPENKAFIPELEAKRQLLDAAKAELKKLREEAGIIEARRLENAKNSVNRRIAELERRIREKDFSKKKPTPLIKDNELIRLNAKKLRIKAEFDKLQYQNELNNRNKVQKFYDGLLEVWGLPRALLATGEFSFMLIQGGIYTLGNWKVARSSFSGAMTALANENKAKQQLKYIQAQEWYPVMKASKLALTEPDAKLEAREEQFLGGWVNYIWDIAGYPSRMGGEKLYEGWKKLNPIRAVERAGVSYLNMIRVQKFLEGSEMLQAQGKTFETHPQDYKNVADVVNTFTGRASLGKGEQFSKELSAVFFSPRNWASMIKSASPYALYHIGKMGSREEGQSSLSLLMKGKVTPSVAQKMAVKDFLKYVAITAGFVVMAAIKYNNDDDDETEVSLDGTSSDFLKIKLGNTRVDPWGGKIQQVVLTNRIISSLSGGDGKSLDYAGKMVINKFNPSASMTYKYLKAERDSEGLTFIDQYGNPISMKEDLWNSVRPIYWQSFAEINKENPTARAGLLHFYGFLGGGTMTYKTPTEIMKAKDVSYDDLEDKDVVDFKQQIQKSAEKYTKKEVEELEVEFAKGVKDIDRQFKKGLIKETDTFKKNLKNIILNDFKASRGVQSADESISSELKKSKDIKGKVDLLINEFAFKYKGKWIVYETLSAQENKIKRWVKKGIIDKDLEKELYTKLSLMNKETLPK